LHSGEKPQLKWLLDDSYDISYESFVPVTGDGFLVAGRCLSAEHEAMASARVTAECFSYGQAIGMAAAVAARWRLAAETSGLRSPRRAAQGWRRNLTQPICHGPTARYEQWQKGDQPVILPR
jgi:FAD dependent oxidoreductase